MATGLIRINPQSKKVREPGKRLGPSPNLVYEQVQGGQKAQNTRC